MEDAKINECFTQLNLEEENLKFRLFDRNLCIGIEINAKEGTSLL